MLTLMVLVIAACSFAQGPVILSPYKDGRPVPDSLKDHKEYPPINLHNSTARKATPANQDNKTANQQGGNTTDEKTKPVVLSPAKKP